MPNLAETQGLVLYGDAGRVIARKIYFLALLHVSIPADIHNQKKLKGVLVMVLYHSSLRISFTEVTCLDRMALRLEVCRIKYIGLDAHGFIALQL